MSKKMIVPVLAVVLAAVALTGCGKKEEATAPTGGAGAPTTAPAGGTAGDARSTIPPPNQPGPPGGVKLQPGQTYTPPSPPASR